MYKDTYIFPAIVTTYADNDYNVSFPDFNGISTYGETLEDAYYMAEDALKLELFDLYEDKLEIPQASNITQIKQKENQILIMVKVNLYQVIKEYDNKAVKKTLTIPAWLNKIAEDEKVNFSQILQLALKEKLNIKDR